MNSKTNKPIGMVMTRFTGRPLHPEFVQALTESKYSYRWSHADFIVAVHGPSEGVTTEFELCHDAFKTERIADCLDLVGKTTERLPPFLRYVLETYSQQYSVVGVVDDDALYTDPMSTMTDYDYAFLLEKDCGGVGPMGAFRKFRRYTYEQNPVYFLNTFERNPWAPMGSQVYRSEALRRMDLSFLDELGFRADAIMAMLLYIHGWKNYEMDVPFRHTMHAGQNTKHDKDADFYRMMADRADREYVIYERVIRENLKECHNEHKLDFMLKEIAKLKRSDQGHHKRKLDELEGRNVKKRPLYAKGR